jgi:hypothetical protein
LQCGDGCWAEAAGLTTDISTKKSTREAAICQGKRMGRVWKKGFPGSEFREKNNGKGVLGKDFCNREIGKESWVNSAGRRWVDVEKIAGRDRG